MTSHRATPPSSRRPRLVRNGTLTAFGLLLTMLLLLVPAGAALAYLTTSGSGTGMSTTGTLTVQVTAVAVSTPLYPGGSADLTVSVSNPAASAVSVSALTVGSISGSGGCSAPAVTVSTSAVPATLPPGNSVFTLTNAVVMGIASSSSCQGAALSIPLTLKVQQ